MINDILNAYAASVRRKFKHDRTQTVGASEIGQCARKTYWAKRSTAHDESHVESWGALLRGTVMEDKFWVPAMRRKFKKDLLYAGSKQRTFAEGYLSATPDALVVNLKYDVLRHLGIKDIEGDCILIDCKSIDPRVNISKEKDVHFFQVQVQLGLVRALTSYKPTYAVLHYIDASFWHEVAEYAVKYDPAVFDQAVKRAEKIITASAPGELPPEGWITGGTECEYCPFKKPCGVITKSVPARECADAQFTAEVTDLCREAQVVHKKAEEAGTAWRGAQEKIKERLREKGVRKLPGVVTWSSVKGRESWDMKGLREAAQAVGLDVEQFSTVGDPSDRLDIRLTREQ